MVSRASRITSLLLTLCMAGAAVPAQLGGDMQAQIVYAFHAEDVNELHSLAQTLATRVESGGVDGALRYHLAHADYRIGLLAEQNPRDAQAAFAQCVAVLKPALRDTGAEALGLQSACYWNLARYEKFQAVLLRSRAADRLNEAMKLAPRNPRLVYLRAIDSLTQSDRDSPDYSWGYAELQLAVQLFEESSATSPDVPGWGHAEAFLELGRQLAARGDVLEARNWIEKALLAAPDYKAARRVLSTLVRR